MLWISKHFGILFILCKNMGCQIYSTFWIPNLSVFALFISMGSVPICVFQKNEVATLEWEAYCLAVRCANHSATAPKLSKMVEIPSLVIEWRKLICILHSVLHSTFSVLSIDLLWYWFPDNIFKLHKIPDFS